MFLVVTSSISAAVKPTTIVQVTSTFENSRLAQPPTVFPPEQADNGAQTYWGMCMSCHGDRAQGLTEEWRASFSPQEGDCWQSGCHGNDAPKNSFVIPQTGAPALVGAGRLSRFSNAFELRNYIQQNMPFFRAGSFYSSMASSPSVLILAAIGWNVSRGRGDKGLSILPARPNFFHHLHPPSIPAEQAEFRYTLAAGGLGIFFSLLLFFTGLLEMYYYVPTPGQAAASIQTINSLIPFGRLIRNLHFWSAQFLVIVMTLHFVGFHRLHPALG